MDLPTIKVAHVHGSSPSSHRPHKLLISPPRINLRRAASYNYADRGPHSSTSSRFGFDHLVFTSPPPSPGLPLPQQGPRKRRSSSHPRPSRVIRLLLWLLPTLFLLYYLTSRSFGHGRALVAPFSLWPTVSDELEMVGQDQLPDFPTPIVLADPRRRPKWTVFIPPAYDFPLTTDEYRDICSKCTEVSSTVHALHRRGPVEKAHISSPAGRDSPALLHFVDVEEAEEQGLLSIASLSSTVPGHQPSDDPTTDRLVLLLAGHQSSLADRPPCKSTLTFVLESDDAGLGKALLSLWTAYGLAIRDRRVFFIDDTRWAYGNYSAIFDPPPPPECRSPPRHQMIPCPSQARHLVVSSANARDILGATIPDADIYAQGPAASLNRRPAQRELFDMARRGYEALFRLNGPDRQYVSDRVMKQRTKTYAVEGEAHNGSIVGVHVRRGDRHPLEFQYADSYIPLSHYADAAHALLDGAGRRHGDKRARSKSFLVLASDDPLVYDADELAGATRAQEQIRLAGKGELQALPARSDRAIMHKFVEETFGWEGGFFAAMFWNLALSPLSSINPPAAGSSSSSSSSSKVNDNQNKNREQQQQQQQQQRQHQHPPPPPPAETVRLRSLVGRAYLMDLAVLADLSDGGGVVCAVSAVGCRLLAVMMGYERAFGRGEWRNVDGDFGWHGLSWE